MRAKLKVKPDAGEPFEIEIGNTATIGRGKDNTVCFSASPHVSRQHAIIRCHDALEYQIMDLGSRNGTFVNGRRVITPTPLAHGAVIRITNNEVIFEQVTSHEMETHYEATIAAGPGQVADEMATVAVMVCDIRGFSTMSEILAEDALARTLGEWFRDAGNVVQESGGIIDKFIGDAILAYWIRSADSNESEAALNTGFKLLEKTTTRHWPEKGKDFHIAVALHHGIVTCGNIGLVAQRDATIIGDVVNTVFRIESLMKGLNMKLAFSQDFLNTLSATTIAFEELGEHQLKGKSQPVRLFGLRN